MISHLLDTCAFLDLVTNQWRNPEAIQTFKTSQRPAILSVSVWELAGKIRKGRLVLPCDPGGLLDFIYQVCAHYQLTIVDLDAETCWHAENLPSFHEDPFDRMILSKASLSNCPVFTSDRQFEHYPVRIFWHRTP